MFALVSRANYVAVSELMANEKKRLGACLCGGVQVIANIENIDLGACHCSKCLKWSGGPFMELECGSDVDFQGEENIQIYQSSRWATRGFCKVCGSHLFIREKSSNHYGIPPGLFENDSGVSFNRQVFFDNKPSYYNFSNSTHNITSEYIYEHFPETREDDD